IRGSLNLLTRINHRTMGLEPLAGIEGEVRQFLEASAAEFEASGGPLERDSIKERIASRLTRLEAGYGRRISRGTGVLATIGATAPFVGLFGPVWGIMNSFH